MAGGSWRSKTKERQRGDQSSELGRANKAGRLWVAEPPGLPVAAESLINLGTVSLQRPDARGRE